MPDWQFEAVADLPDEMLASLFGVPVDQVREKRKDLVARDWLRTVEFGS